MTITTTETPTVDWTNNGTKVLPVQYRDQFLAHLAGDRTNGVDRCNNDGETPTWRSPNGSFPMSPGMSLEAVINEFDIRPVTQVSHNLAWEAHDTTGQPGYFGDFSATYTILGVRTRKQTLWFLDGGVSITPLLIVTDGPHELIEEGA